MKIQLKNILFSEKIATPFRWGLVLIIKLFFTHIEFLTGLSRQDNRRVETESSRIPVKSLWGRNMNLMYCLLISFALILPDAAKAQKDFSHVPGIVVAYRPASDKIYLGTPSICILPDGRYVCSLNEFGKNTNMTLIFESLDKGKNWSKISEFNGKQHGLFFHNSTLYAMGVDQSYGNCVIRKSSDKGHSWTTPTDSGNGLLRMGDAEKGYHTSSVSVVIANDRIWRPVEVARKRGKWGDFESLVMSVPIDADLLNSENWKTSTRMALDVSWGNQYGTWLEGGAVISPKGEIINILRVDNRAEETAALIRVSDNGELLSFDHEKDFIRFPGGCKKFNVRYDKYSKRYWSLSNWIPKEFKGHNIERTRNTLALISSPDLRNWTVHSVILQDDNVEKSGFQYVDWQFENDDIIFLSRTAFFDGENYADNQHNSNFITFHRIEDFRNQEHLVLKNIKNIR